MDTESTGTVLRWELPAWLDNPSRLKFLQLYVGERFATIASVSRQEKGWHRIVDRQGPWQQERSALAPDETTATRWADTWAARALDRLTREVASKPERRSCWTDREARRLVESLRH